MSLAVANRYARALADVLLKPGSGVTPREALDQLQAFERAVKDSPGLRQVLLSPAVTSRRKAALLGRLEREMGLSRPIRNFLCVVVEHRRAAMLGEIRGALERLLDERLGLVKVEVTCAREWTPARQKALEAQLARLAGKGVRPEYRVDAGILGGAVARIGSTVYDGSVRGQLESLRRRLVREA